MNSPVRLTITGTLMYTGVEDLTSYMPRYPFATTASDQATTNCAWCIVLEIANAVSDSY